MTDKLEEREDEEEDDDDETVRDDAFNMVFSLHENIALKLYFILFISLRPCKTTSREMVISVMMLREHTMTVSICMR